MNIVESLLVIIIILLIIALVNPQIMYRSTSSANARVLPPTPQQTVAPPQAENFHTESDFDYEHIAPEKNYLGDMTYSDIILAQGVDKKTIANHREFSQDRINNSFKNITGKTMALGELEGTDQTPWWGIRGRPQAVPVGNPAQIPDVDPNVFSDKLKFRW